MAWGEKSLHQGSHHQEEKCCCNTALSTWICSLLFRLQHLAVNCTLSFRFSDFNHGHHSNLNLNLEIAHLCIKWHHKAWTNIGISPVPNFVASVVSIKQTKRTQTAPLLCILQVLYSQTLTEYREKCQKLWSFSNQIQELHSPLQHLALAVLNDLTQIQIPV